LARNWDAIRQTREGEDGNDVERFVDLDDDDDEFDARRAARGGSRRVKRTMTMTITMKESRGRRRWQGRRR
jgi:hypothetical protein